MKPREGMRSIMMAVIILSMFTSAIPISMGYFVNYGNNIASGPVLPEPDYVIGNDLIVSYDEATNFNDALHPDVAVAPPGSPNEGTIHAVWDELDEISGYREIHYSMSVDGGRTWNHDLDDFVISNNLGKANSGDAVTPSIAIDIKGFIHVIWAEQMFIDKTWEVMYSRSEDNGKTWTGTTTGDVRISFVQGSELDAKSISNPKLEVGHSGIVPEILHAVWSEVDSKFTQQEVHYSRSLDGGNFWSGIEGDDILSTIDGIFAYNPDIACSAADARFVHVAWNQLGPNGVDEVSYVVSDSFGDKGTWTLERPISFVLDDGMVASNISICGSALDEVYVVWKQYPKGTPDSELFYSGSIDNGKTWSGESADYLISFPDGNEAFNPSVGIGDKRLQVVWTELDESSPLKTLEVHTSWTDNPTVPDTWTGIKNDIVLSNGDDWGPADAKNVSFEFGFINRVWTPMFVWDELNDGPTKANRADRNTEIHAPPVEWTLSTFTSGSGSVSVSPVQTTYIDGTTVTLTAVPSPGWSFDHWSGNISGTTNPQTMVMDWDKTVTAYFTQDQYTLTINNVGNGSVSKSPSQLTYTYGTVVQLTATPDFGWHFDHWAVGLAGSTNPTNITIYGNSVVTAYFTLTTHNISLTAGWNLVSIPLIQSNTSISSVLQSIAGKYDIVRYYNSSDVSDPWKIYRPGAGTFNDLADIDHTMALWIHTTSACTLTAHGNYPSSTSIYLRTGWNFVGYPTGNATRTVAQALAGTNYDGMEAYDALNPYLLKTLAGTDVMAPGEGYWVHVPADIYWTVDW